MDSLQAGRVNFGVLGLVLEVSGLGSRIWGLGYGVSRRRLHVLKGRAHIKQERCIDVVQ